MGGARAYVGRLAPSPTGALHLGNVRTFLIAWLRARQAGGKVILRLEDLDHPKDKPGAAAAAIEDLRWLGFDWDEEYVQSARKAIYAAATRALHEAGCIYPCVCSRRDVETAQSAPHAGEQLYYPGTCRGRFATWQEACRHLRSEDSPARTPCWRFRVAPGTVVSYTDGFAGPFRQDVAATLGDFPLARDEGGAGYTLAATLDDLLMGVTEVVRGDDLLAATPAQILLAQALRKTLPGALRGVPDAPLGYYHVPLVVGPDGRRLAKRHGDTRIASFRAQGLSAAEIIGRLAATCSWCDPSARLTLKDLLTIARFDAIPARPVVASDGALTGRKPLA